MAEAQLILKEGSKLRVLPLLRMLFFTECSSSTDEEDLADADMLANL